MTRRRRLCQPNTDKVFFERTVKSEFYLDVMGDPKTGVAPKKYVVSLLSLGSTLMWNRFVH
ncbi:hypothetical protein C8J56DRAFT_783502 [Mycena floridula]|nr:hypothetical protein C8J56DRAFT_783502 [Mycena floridula]